MGSMRVVPRKPAAVLAVLFLASASIVCRNDGAAPGALVYGYGEVYGTVYYANGTPLLAGAEVTVTGCEHPIGGLAGEGKTVSGGTYRITAPLAPYYEIPGDTLHLSCVVDVQRGFARAPVDVIFTRAGEERIPVRVDLTEGDSVPH